MIFPKSKPGISHQFDQGASLVELVVAVALLAIIAAALSSITTAVRFFLNPPNPGIANAALLMSRDLASRQGSPNIANGCMSLGVTKNDLSVANVAYVNSGGNLERSGDGSQSFAGVYCYPTANSVELFADLGSVICPVKNSANAVSRPAGWKNQCDYEIIYFVN